MSGELTLRLVRHNAQHTAKHRHLCPEPRIHLREPHADVACADDDHGCRQPLRSIRQFGLERPVELADGVALSIPACFGQPFLQVLLRPEEIVAASGAAFKHHRLWRRNSHQLAPLKDDANTIGAVCTGIIDRHRSIGVAAADQQHEVNRAGHVEDFAAR